MSLLNKRAFVIGMDGAFEPPDDIKGSIGIRCPGKVHTRELRQVRDLVVARKVLHFLDLLRDNIDSLDLTAKHTGQPDSAPSKPTASIQDMVVGSDLCVACEDFIHFE